jgi:hypothetical protein
MKSKLACIAVITIMICAVTAQAKSLTYGTGPIKIILFTDFFCSPCQQMESSIEVPLYDSLKKGKVAITFIPVPLTRMSVPMAYHYIAASDGKTYEESVSIRKDLIKIAKSGKINNNLLGQWQNKANSARPYLQHINDTIKRYGVKSTPSCVISYADQEITYTGSRDIEEAILRISQ